MDDDSSTSTGTGALTECRLTIVADELQAEMVRSLLDSHGIASVVRRPALGEIQWGTINTGMGGAREVIVAATDLEQARAVLADAELESDATETELDPAYEDMRVRSNRAGVWWALVVIALFGVPLAVWLLAMLTGIADGMR